MNGRKARAWDKAYKQYAPLWAWFVDGNGDAYWWLSGRRADELEIEYSLNTTDVTGNEVYDGDKVEIIEEETTQPDYERFYGWEVCLDEPFAPMLKPSERNDAIPMFSFEYRAGIKVIGNKHDSESKERDYGYYDGPDGIVKIGPIEITFHRYFGFHFFYKDRPFYPRGLNPLWAIAYFKFPMGFKRGLK